MYAFYFILLYTTTANSMQFAFHVLIAADPEAFATVGGQTNDVADQVIDRRLLCFIAFTITAFICLLLYFSATKSRYLNAATALAKVLLLIAVFGAGCNYIRVNGTGSSSWSTTISGNVLGWPAENKLGWSQGLLTVFFSYHGWENATFVSATGSKSLCTPLTDSPGRRRDPKI